MGNGVAPPCRPNPAPPSMSNLLELQPEEVGPGAVLNAGSRRSSGLLGTAATLPQHLQAAAPIEFSLAKELTPLLGGAPPPRDTFTRAAPAAHRPHGSGADADLPSATTSLLGAACPWLTEAAHATVPADLLRPQQVEVLAALPQAALPVPPPPPPPPPPPSAMQARQQAR